MQRGWKDGQGPGHSGGKKREWRLKCTGRSETSSVASTLTRLKLDHMDPRPPEIPRRCLYCALTHCPHPYWPCSS